MWAQSSFSVEAREVITLDFCLALSVLANRVCSCDVVQWSVNSQSCWVCASLTLLSEVTCVSSLTLFTHLYFTFVCVLFVGVVAWIFFLSH